MDEIETVVASGKEVTIHEAPISAHGFSGSGFFVIDSETGAGGYLIEGGARGGVLGYISYVTENGPQVLLPPCGVTYLQCVIDNFIATNTAIPGLTAPTGAGLLTATIVAKEVGGMTVIQGIQLAMKNSQFLLGNLRAALIVSIINYIVLSIAYEIGILIGSAVGAAFCRRPN
jgi:hypothetical protein